MTSRLLVLWLVPLLAVFDVAIAQQDGGGSANDEFLEALYGDSQKSQAAEDDDPPSEESTGQDRDSAEVIELEEEEPPRVALPKRSRQIDEIVVTATKREASVRDIPASIAAFDGEELEKSGVQELADLVKLTPGVNLADDGVNAKRVTIRGVAPSIGLNFTTGTLIGDVPFSDPFLPKVALDPNPFDMQTVEVLKGPQGTLFGGSGLNGAVRYVPTPPQFEERQARYYAQYQSFRHGSAAPSYGAVWNHPLGNNDAMAVRLMAFQRGKAGYIDEIGRGEKDVNTLDQWGLRGQWAWDVSERLGLSFIWTQQTTDIGDIGFVGPEEAQSGRLERDNTPVEGFTDTQYQLGSANLTYAFDWAELLALSAVTDKTWHNLTDVSRVVSGEVESLVLRGHNVSRSLIHELRLTSPSTLANWEWVAGLFHSRNELDDQLDFTGSDMVSLPQVLNDPVQIFGANIPGFGGLITEDGFINTLRAEVEARTTELALFGEASRRVGSRWRLSLGLRAYQTKIDGVARSSGALVAPAFEPGETESTNANVIEDSGLSPKFSARFDWTDTAMVYATVSRGFRFGGLQLLTQAGTEDVPDTYASDSLWSYELGWRTSWLSNNLQFDGAAFFLDWDRPQVLRPAFNGVFNVIENVGGARSQGIELAVNYLPPIEGLALLVSGSIVDTVTTTPFESNASAFSGSESGELPPGQRWPQAPKFQTLAKISYERSVGDWLPSIAVTHSYIDDAFQNLENTVEVFGYGTVDLQLGLAHSRQGWWPELSLNVTNLTDERGVAAVTNALEDVLFIPPRAFLLRLSGSF